MPISSSLTARLGPGAAPSPSPAPTRRSPYTRPSEPRRAGAGGGRAKACRLPLRLEPATERLLGPARRAVASSSSCGAEAAAPDVAAPTRRRCADEKSDQKTDPKTVETNPEPHQEPRVQESRGCGGFGFLGALAGHTEAITGISMPMGSDKLYSGSADGSVRVWDYNSGKGLRTIFGMHRVGRTPVLFCSLHNSSCIRLFDLPSFDERGKLYSKKEVKTIELAAGGLLFTGDGAGELKVWRWAPQNEEPRTPVLE